MKTNKDKKLFYYKIGYHTHEKILYVVLTSKKKYSPIIFDNLIAEYYQKSFKVSELIENEDDFTIEDLYNTMINLLVEDELFSKINFELEEISNGNYPIKIGNQKMNKLINQKL